MILRLERYLYSNDGIFGTLYGDDLKPLCKVLEHAYPSIHSDGRRSDYEAKLPEGTYSCVRGTHRLHDNIPFETFEIEGVKGHDNILFHAGNYNGDSEGCLLLGATVVFAPNDRGRMVTNSKATFKTFMQTLKGVDNFTLIVINL